MDSTAPTPIDVAVHSIVRWLGCEDDLGSPDLAAAVDTFMAQLADVVATATSAHDFIAAGAALAREHPGAVAAGWAGYITGIRSLDRMYEAATAAVVAEAEEYLHGEK